MNLSESNEFPDSELAAYDDSLCESCHGTGVDDEAEDGCCRVCDGTGYVESE